MVDEIKRKTEWRKYVIDIPPMKLQMTQASQWGRDQCPPCVFFMLLGREVWGALKKKEKKSILSHHIQKAFAWEQLDYKKEPPICKGP